jgi:hypothetical protein
MWQISHSLKVILYHLAKNLLYLVHFASLKNHVNILKAKLSTRSGFRTTLNKIYFIVNSMIFKTYFMLFSPQITIYVTFSPPKFYV